MRINCDLDLSWVSIECESKEDAFQLMTKIMAPFLSQCGFRSLKALASCIDIESNDNSIKVNFINNNYYFYSIPRILRAAFGFDVSIKLKEHDPKNHLTIILNELAWFIVNHASPEIQFNLKVTDVNEKEDEQNYKIFEAELSRQLSTSIDPSRFERVAKYLTLNLVEKSNGLSQQIQSLVLKDKYGEKAEKSAVIIQSFFRDFSRRKEINSLKQEIKNALDVNQNLLANQLMNKLLDLEQAGKSLTKLDRAPFSSICEPSTSSPGL